MAATHQARNVEAIIHVTLATALFSLVFASGKFAGDTASPLQIIFLRYVGGFLTLVAVLGLRGETPATLRSDRPLSHLARAVSGGYGGVAIIAASASMPVVDATAISLLYVVFMIGLGVLVLGERIAGRHWLGIALCCAGAAAIMVSRGAFRQFDSAYVLPALLALAGALLIAIEGILIKKLSHADRPETVLIHVNAIGIALMAVPALLTWRSASVADNWPFLALGPVAITAQFLVILGYRLADVSVVGPVDYSWLVFAAAIGWYFFGETPTAGVVAGSALIAAGGIVLAMLRPASASTTAGTGAPPSTRDFTGT